MKYNTFGGIIYKQKGVRKMKLVCIEIETQIVKIIVVGDEISRKVDMERVRRGVQGECCK
jgi:hypothetical protein